jgi:DNA-binding transcriptional ArsR family regulator
VTGDRRPLSLSALSERTEIPLSTVQREIAQLERAGLVASERVGQTRLVYANEESPYFHELESILLKAFGPAHLLGDLLGRVP